MEEIVIPQQPPFKALVKPFEGVIPATLFFISEIDVTLAEADWFKMKRFTTEITEDSADVTNARSSSLSHAPWRKAETDWLN